jgi:hypothetical protein
MVCIVSSVPLVCTFIIKSDIVIWHITWWNEVAPEKYKKEVNDLIWKFIWDNKPNQIERNVCCYWCIDCIKMQNLNSYMYSFLRTCVLLNNLWTSFLRFIVPNEFPNQIIHLFFIFLWCHFISPCYMPDHYVWFIDECTHKWYWWHYIYHVIYQITMSDLMMHVHTCFADNTIYTMWYMCSWKKHIHQISCHT